MNEKNQREKAERSFLAIKQQKQKNKTTKSKRTRL